MEVFWLKLPEALNNAKKLRQRLKSIREEKSLNYQFDKQLECIESLYKLNLAYTEEYFSAFLIENKTVSFSSFKDALDEIENIPFKKAVHDFITIRFKQKKRNHSAAIEQ